ncbi:hypothetical protein C2E23DRAFT_886747 [Lenzites betulinus]|nr:hypothetical protein C2E23DRAFT_886747 [Lenzites betulinus]
MSNQHAQGRQSKVSMNSPQLSTRQADHTLPMELIQAVFFEIASVDTLEAVKLCRICRIVRHWVLPILYEDVTLATSAAIERFAASLTLAPKSDAASVEGAPSPASCVRRLWIGPVSTDAEGDLSYDPFAWPIPHVHAILTRCTSLRALALMNLHQRTWPRLALAVPAGVEVLWLGPVHGRVDWRYLPCAPRTREFLTLDTYVTEAELRQIVAAPSMRRVCRFFSDSCGYGIVHQAGCVEDAQPALERLEIVCCDRTRVEAAAGLKLALRRRGYEPIPRVVFVPRSNRYQGRYDPLAILFDDWMDASRC